MIAVDGGRPPYTFLQYIRLTGDDFTIEGPDGTFPFEGGIIYTGTVRAYMPDTIWTFLPVKETGNQHRPHDQAGRRGPAEVAIPE